jgi:hypothetical protein
LCFFKFFSIIIFINNFCMFFRIDIQERERERPMHASSITSSLYNVVFPLTSCKVFSSILMVCLVINWFGKPTRLTFYAHARYLLKSIFLWKSRAWLARKAWNLEILTCECMPYHKQDNSSESGLYTIPFAAWIPRFPTMLLVTVLINIKLST